MQVKHPLQAYLVIFDTFLYTSPTNGVSGPKIIPSNKDTVTKGISTSVNFIEKICNRIYRMI